MKNVIAIAAVAGVCVAASATAQSVKLTFAASASEVVVGDTVSWTVEASFTGLSATGYFGGFNGDFLASDNSLGTATNFVNNMAFEGVPATANGADVNLNVFNSALLGSDDQSLGIFFTFDVVTAAEGTLSYDASGVATLFNSDFIFDPAIEFTSFPVNTDEVRILVPAPGAVALLGLGGLVAGRRRR